MEKIVSSLERAYQQIGDILKAYQKLSENLNKSLDEFKSIRGGILDISHLGSDIVLTPRQQLIFKLIGQNMNPSQIANRLKLSKRTVEAHRDTIRKKYGFKTVQELTRFAISEMEP